MHTDYLHVLNMLNQQLEYLAAFKTDGVTEAQASDSALASDLA